ncbi:MAG: polysaccharide deacetylase family protein [Gammaproteobacteria bacterium]
MTVLGLNAKKTLKIAAARTLDQLRLTRMRKGGLVILMLHKVNDDPDPLALTLSPRLLEMIICEVQEHHAIVSLSALDMDRELQIAEGLRFAFTFDDGYRDNYENAFPLLCRHGVPATIYLSVDHIDGKRSFWYERLAGAIKNSRAEQLDMDLEGIGSYQLRDRNDRRAALLVLNRRLKCYDDGTREQFVDLIAERLRAPELCGITPMLTWGMIKEMAAANITFGSHTLSHPILSRETIERVRAELLGSKEVLEEVLGGRITAFAYPNGTREDFNVEVVAEVRKAGYQHACTTIPGVNGWNTDPFELRRINLHNDMCTDHQGQFVPALFWANALALL